MKPFILLSFLLFAVASCTHIYFKEVQPKRGERLTKIPLELQGTWFDKNDGWKVTESGFIAIDLKLDSLNQVVDTVYESMLLSDSTRLYKAKDLYVLNFKKDSPHWEIVVLQPQANGGIAYYFISDPKVFANVKGLKLEEATYIIDDELRSVKTLDPHPEQSSEFQSAVFSGQMNPRSLKKALKSDAPTIFGKDGKIHEPVNDSIN